MKFNHLTTVAGAIAVVLGVSACGGGGGSDTTAATSANTATVGTITGFGSVFVNGVEYETNSASITIDGSPATEADLAVGMVARLDGSASGSTGVALSINVADELEGVVQSNAIPPAGTTGTMVIMGQTVTIDANTLFESKVATITAFDQIAAGNIVEVNGYGDGNGNIIATRIEVKAVDMASYGGSIELKGVISNLDSVAQTFDLGGLSVDYSGARLDNLTLANGLYVEVRSDTAPVGSLLTATRVELEDDGKKGYQGEDGEEMEIKGIIATVAGNSFTLVDGTRVVTDGNTRYDDDHPVNLVANAMVEVEGNFNAAGELVARKISMEDNGVSSPTEYQGMVLDVTATAVNTGTITLQDGSVFQVTNTTIMKDDRNNGVHRFNLQQLETAWNAGESPYVEINAYTDATTGNLIAVKLERK